MSHSPVFAVFFSSNRPFVGYFQWNACTYFQKICIWTRHSDARLIKNISNFFALFRFSFRKTTFKSKFSEFFTSKRHFVGYFQWNACTYFQKTCIWTRYSNVKLINKISNILVALLHFGFRKEPNNLNFHSFFTSYRAFCGYFQWKSHTYFQKICIWTRYSDAKFMKKIFRSNF